MIDTILLLSQLVIVFLVGVIFFYLNQIKKLKSSIKELNKSLSEMDEQAKLIIHTDIELNKTQEELNKKINSLYALQKISQGIINTLEESEIFKRIEPVYLEEMGFNKALVFMWSKEKNEFINYLNIGYSAKEYEFINSYLKKNTPRFLEIVNKQITFSSLYSKEPEEIKNVFRVLSFVFTPIWVEEKTSGFLFVGTDRMDIALTEGDKELITILGTQISQALKNAHLFTELWQTQQSLEKKVIDRTQQLTQALEELQKISRRKTDFIWSVTHELRTPLTSIKGYASILLSGKLGQIPEEAHKRIERINEQTNSLIELVNSLLDIARIEAGRVIMQPQVSLLREIVQKIVDLLSLQIKEKELKVTVDIKEEQKAFVDPSQIERVFINLLSNAIKFTPAQGKIVIRAEDIDENTLRVDVSDNGCGIPEEAQELIFEEFYRVDNPINQQVKGTGLGLSLVKQIIQAHNGKIWVRSKLGEGTTFSFTLPKRG